MRRAELQREQCKFYHTTITESRDSAQVGGGSKFFNWRIFICCEGKGRSSKADKHRKCRIGGVGSRQIYQSYDEALRFPWGYDKMARGRRHAPDSPSVGLKLSFGLSLW